MKMPASGGDPVSSTLRLAFSPNSKVRDLDSGIESSAKRVLLSRIEYEPATDYRSSVQTTLKSKYIVINSKNSVNNGNNNNGKVVNSNGNVNGSPSKKQSSVCLPVPKLTLFPSERVQLGYRGNMSVGSGMLNMGNTCYLNSTLQALFHVPALVNWLMSETSHTKCEQNSNFQTHPDDITCSLIKTFKCSQQKTGNCMKPICIYSKLKAICKHLNHGSQEDAHEFMRYLLESLEKSFLTRFQGHKLDSCSKETTPINQIFGGYIRTEVQCLACRAVSTTFQHFQDLPLDIRKASTLDDALAGYFEREPLPEGEDAYRCDKCCRKVPATKKFSIEKPPYVLCVQLKRFSMMNGKITKQVQLPQYLDITRFISPSVGRRHQVRYRLVSMVTHMGQSANCGHYTAIALAANGIHYHFDDSSVRQISLSTVLNMSAYLVLYEMEPNTPHSPRPYSAHTAVTSWSNQESVTKPPTPAVLPTPRQEHAGSKPCPPVVAASPPRVTASPSSGAGGSLVPYESDEEEPAHSELEKLLTKPARASDTWQVTEEGGERRVPLPGTSASASSWSVTDCNSRNSCSDRDRPGTSNGAAATAADTSDRALCNKLERQVIERKKDVMNTLTQGSHSGYGSSGIKSWNGNTSHVERELEEERARKRRSEEELYNEDYDTGKVKKMKIGGQQLQQHYKPQYNAFQQRANQNHQHWKHNKQWNNYPNNNYHKFKHRQFRNNSQNRRPNNDHYGGKKRNNYMQKQYHRRYHNHAYAYEY